MPTDRRKRLISLAGAVLLVVLCSSAVTVWLTAGRGGNVPLGDRIWDPFGIGSGSQPGASAAPSASASSSTARPSPTPSANAVASRSPLKASYKTIALLGLGGFDTEVTVSNPGGAAHQGWTLELTMPADRQVENRSSASVKMVQSGTKISLTPLDPTLAAGKSLTFTVRFPALLALGQAVTACTLDGQPCATG